MTSGLITLLLLFLFIFFSLLVCWAVGTWFAEKDLPPWPPREDL